MSDFAKAWSVSSWFLDASTFAHSRRVTWRVWGLADEMTVAILHDFVEDGGQVNALEYLRDEVKLSGHIIEAVDAISRRDGETYFEYIQRVKANPLATRVKLADIEDNLTGRENPPKPSLRDRYEKAKRILLEME